MAIKIPKGIQQTGQTLLDIIDPRDLLKGTVQDLKDIKAIYQDAANRVSNVQSPAVGDSPQAPDENSNPDNVIAKQKRGGIETHVFPKDYSRELCFRMDFMKFERQSVFEDTKMLPLQTFILPLPRTIGFNQGVGYSQQELGLFGEVEARTRTVQITGNAQEIATEAAKEAGAGLAGAALRAFTQTDAGRVASQAFGFIPNPHLSNIFTGVALRQFRFQIQLTPRSEDEAGNLILILDKLRANSLPTRSKNFTTLDYPNECLISFSEAGSKMVLGGTGKTPLDRIFKFQRCSLTDLEVSINQAGDQAFFRDYSPVEITVDLGFTENQIMTAELFDKSDAYAATEDKYRDTFSEITESLLGGSTPPAGTDPGDTPPANSVQRRRASR